MAYFVTISNIHHMKSLFTLLFAVFTISAFAQGQAKSTAAAKPTSSGNCYNEWYSTFRERGAKQIPNGTHDVVISIRHGNYSDCFIGKVDVFGGKLSSRPQVQKVDGTYEEWDRRISANYFDSDGKIKDTAILEINNGMSSELTGSEGEMVRIFFYQFVAEKPKANKKAPSPSDLIKN